MLILFDFMYILCYTIITLNIFGGVFMYIKVHKKGKDWFRYDKGTLVGKDVPYGEIFEHLKHLLGDKKFFIKNKKNEYLPVYHGYFDQSGNFIHFCEKDCSSCPGWTSSIFCTRIPNEYKSRGGYYIKTH